MKYPISLLLILVAAFAVANEPPVVLWSQSWDGPDNRSDVPHQVAMDADGSMVVLGKTNYVNDDFDGSHMALARYDAAGSLQWSAEFPDQHGKAPAGLMLDDDGAAVFSSVSRTAGGQYNLDVIKVDPQGEIAWQVAVPVAATNGSSWETDLGRDEEGDWCATASHWASGLVLAKISDQGLLLWTRIEDAGGSRASAGLTGGTGGHIFVAATNGAAGNSANRYDAAGELLWEVAVAPEQQPGGAHIVALPDGGCIFTTEEALPYFPAVRTFRLDADGQILWQKRYPDPEMTDVGLGETTLLVDANGQIYIAGHSGTGFVVVSLDAQGQELWVAEIAQPNEPTQMSGAGLDPSGHVVVFGTTFNSPSFEAKHFLADFSPAGEVAWSLTMDNTGFCEDVAFTPDGSLVTLGTVEGSGSLNYADWSIMKLVAATSSVDDMPTVAAGHVQAYPNPFNPMTTIRYRVAKDGPVRLSIYDAAGRLVRTLIDGDLSAAGENEIVWSGRDNAGRAQASGTYLLRMQSAAGESRTRLTLVR